MPTEFEFNYDDFSDELDSLTDVASATGVGQTGGSARARTAASNAATLLLAAVFEEYIRQQVKTAFRIKVKNATDIRDFPPRLASQIWRRSLDHMQRVSFDEDSKSDLEARVTAIVAFCIRQDISADIADLIAHNVHNMRPTQVKELFGQMGIQSIMSRICEDRNVMQLVGASKPGQAVTELESRIEEFFKRRNLIAHAIGLGSSSGPSELLNEIELFRTFARALVRVLESEVS